MFAYHKSVASDELAVGLRVVDQVVGPAEGEGTLRRLSGVPFHRVLGGELAEVGDNDSGIGSNVQGAGIAASPPVLLAVGLELGVQARGSGKARRSAAPAGGRAGRRGAGGAGGSGSTAGCDGTAARSNDGGSRAGGRCCRSSRGS